MTRRRNKAGRRKTQSTSRRKANTKAATESHDNDQQNSRGDSPTEDIGKSDFTHPLACELVSVDQIKSGLSQGWELLARSHDGDEYAKVLKSLVTAAQIFSTVKFPKQKAAEQHLHLHGNDTPAKSDIISSIAAELGVDPDSIQPNS